MRKTALLPARSVVSVTGADRVAFLQGLVSNDVALADGARSVWAALLTPQGKYLADFFVVADGERLLLDLEASVAADTVARLSRFRLRAAVALAPCPALHVAASWDGDPAAAAPSGDGVVRRDPRHPEAGLRTISERPVEANSDEADYDRHRLLLGLPDGTRDLEREKSLLLEAGFDELDGISWTKGCYMGQELTARTRYRGLLKRRLVPVFSDHALPPAGTPLTGTPTPGGGALREIGTMRSSRDGLGLATVRLGFLHETLHATDPALGDIVLHTRVPDWMRLPPSADATPDATDPDA